MTYIVYDKSTGQIVRTYQKIVAESGEIIPADQEEILTDLPNGLTSKDVAVIAQKDLAVEKGKSYAVDTVNRELIAKEVK